MTGTYAHKFTSSDVNTSDNTILWPGHGLQSGDVPLYVPSSGDTHVGGLQRFQSDTEAIGSVVETTD